MLRRSLTAGLLLVLAAMFTFVGCSDDSNPADSNVGDPNSAAFQPMKAAISTAVDSSLGMAIKFAYKPNRFPSDVGYDQPELGPMDSLIYNYVGDWHILYLGLATGVGYNFSYVDSARLWEGDRAVKFYVEGKTTGLDFRHHQTSTYTGTNDEYSDLSTFADVNFRDINEDAPYFYGYLHVNIDHNYVVNNEQQNVNYDCEVTANDVSYLIDENDAWYNSHATGGDLNIVMNVDDSQQIVEWQITVEFDQNGVAHIVATNTVTEKVYTYAEEPQYQ